MASKTFDRHDDTRIDADRAARFLALARRALAHYGLPADAPLTLMNAVHNTVYRVDAEGARYVLRLSDATRKPAAWRASERLWLRTLHDAGLRVPRPLDGDPHSGEIDGTPTSATLFTWVDGEALTRATFTPARLHAAGTVAARMHDLAARTPFPADFARPRLDQGGLFGKHAADGTPSQYASAAEDVLFSAAQRDTIRAVGERVQATMDALATQPGQFTLIHADLIAKNILFDDEGRAGVIDFDECAWGYTLYDLTPLLWLARADAGYAAYRAALWAGYTAVRPQPEAHLDHLETLVAARHVASCRWVAANADNPTLKGRVRAVLDERIAELNTFLASGRITRRA